MADIVFDTYLDHLAKGTAIWTTDSVRAMLVNANTWTPSKSDGFVATILSAGATEVTASPYARQVLGTKAEAIDGTNHRIQLTAALIDFGAMAAAQNYDHLVIFRFVTNDADSWLMCAFDLGALTTNGVVQQFAPDATGVFRITAP